MVLELASTLGIPAEEADLDLFDAAAAEEAFMTSTSLCLCPIASINGRPVGTTYGPVTRALIEAWSAEIGLDFVEQYLDRLVEPVTVG
jgi:branched-chain amino acid aminotransferase